MPETCTRCGMETAFQTDVSFWRSPETAVVQLECSNCRTTFSRIKHATAIARNPRMTMSAFSRYEDDPYNVDNSWSPYSSRRSSIIKVSSKPRNYTAWNRSRTTASIKDIKAVTHNVCETEEFTIEETNLEIRSNS